MLHLQCGCCVDDDRICFLFDSVIMQIRKLFTLSLSSFQHEDVPCEEGNVCSRGRMAIWDTHQRNDISLDDEYISNLNSSCAMCHRIIEKTWKLGMLVGKLKRKSEDVENCIDICKEFAHVLVMLIYDEMTSFNRDFSYDLGNFSLTFTGLLTKDKEKRNVEVTFAEVLWWCGFEFIVKEMR